MTPAWAIWSVLVVEPESVVEPPTMLPAPPRTILAPEMVRLPATW